MRRFNPDKELRKIQKGNKNKIIFGVIALLIIISIGSTYALYQVRYSKRIIYTKVSPFYNKDIQLAVYVDGIKQDNFPTQDEGKIYTGIECDKEYSEAYFDNKEWKLHLTSDGPNKCKVKFETGNLPNPPELYQGMIPVVYGKNGIMYVADTNSDWYNYQDHRWGNAVLVDASNETIKNKYFKEDNSLREDIVGKEVPMEEVLQMYVWIPRYKYQLWNVDNESKPKQLINIKFEKDTENTGDITCTYTDMKDGTVEEKCIKKGTQEVVQNNDWYTHPAFTFGDTELKGIWVGKFEPSDKEDPTGRNVNVIKDLTILPDKTSMTYKSISTAFVAEQKLKEVGNKYNLKTAEVDTHMMKNSEWGVVAYLTQSIYGIYKDEKTCNIDGMDFATCEVWINNTAQGTGSSGTWAFGGTYTGCVGDSVSASVEWNQDEGAPAKCKVGNKWNENGVKASTTGNMYGIYDMVGGVWEHLMGAIVNQTGGGLYILGSGFTLTPGQTNTLPESKYYDIYTFSESYLTVERGHLGDATREIAKWIDDTANRWNSDSAEFPSAPESEWNATWFTRGGSADGGASAGIFNFGRSSGGGFSYRSFRSVLSAA